MNSTNFSSSFLLQVHPVQVVYSATGGAAELIVPYLTGEEAPQLQIPSQSACAAGLF